MARTPAPTALLALPPVDRHSALCAGLMAMSVPPTAMLTVPTDRRERGQLLARLAEPRAMVAFADLSPGGSADTPTLAEIDALVPAGPVRSRVYLTRLAGGHVSDADRHWACSLGFADVVPEFDAQDCEGQLRTTLDAGAATPSMPALPPVELARYAKVMSPGLDHSSPRAVIRALTGLSAEGLATRLPRSLTIEDRSDRLQRYPRGFVGAEAVAWMERRLHRSAAKALGLLVHVTHAPPSSTTRSSTDRPRRLRGRRRRSETRGKRTQFAPAFEGCGRSHSRKNGCDVGLFSTRCSRRASAAQTPGPRVRRARHSERCSRPCTVRTVCASRHATPSVEAMRTAGSLPRPWRGLPSATHRLTQFGLIEHVTQARLFIDGDYYRFRLAPEADRS